MKLIISLLFLIASIKTYSCDCDAPELLDSYRNADFVARVMISKNYPNQNLTQIYKSNIIIGKLYKGKPVRSILIKGSSDGKRRSSCDVFFKTGTELLVYARDNGMGRYMVDFCSPTHTLEKQGNRSQVREVAMLDFLIDNDIPVPRTPIHTVDVYKKLEKLHGIRADRDFGIFDVVFADSLKVDSVKILTGFDPKIDSILVTILKEARWIDGRDYISRTQKKLPPGCHLLFAFYYYHSEGKHPGFISENDL